MFDDYRKRSLDSGLEEAYKRLFPFIARDFVARADVMIVLDKIIEELNPYLEYDKELNSEALRIAIEYRKSLGE